MSPPREMDPFVDPAWRFLRAAQLVAEGQRTDHPRDDAMSRTAWRFQRALSRCRDDAQREALARAMPTLYEAHLFQTTADPFQKAALEARLLAGQDDNVIAARCGLSPAAVAAYHDIFFCVRHQLHAELYILTRVLDAKIHRGLTQNDRGLILKLVGYSTGPLAVDSVLDYYAHPPQFPADPGRLGREDLKAWCGKLRVQALLVSLTTAAHERRRTAEVLQDLIHQLHTAERMPAETSSALRLPEEAVAAWVREACKSRAGEGQTVTESAVEPAGAPGDALDGSGPKQKAPGGPAAALASHAARRPGSSVPRTPKASGRRSRREAPAALAG